MPIYNYRCLNEDCRKHFERIVARADSNETIDCPECKNTVVQKLMSVFGNYTISGPNGASTRPKRVARGSKV